MKQSTYDIICPKCGKAYNIPIESLRTQSGRKKRKMRCGDCDAVWPIGLKTTSSYGAYFYSHGPDDAIAGTPEDSWSIPPTPAPAPKKKRSQTFVSKESAASLRSYWALFDKTADKPAGKSAPRPRTDLRDLAPSWSLRQKIAREASTTAIASAVRMPKMPPSHKNKKLDRKTPFVTEVRDSWAPPSTQVIRRPDTTPISKYKMALWITSGVLVASFSLIIPFIVLGSHDSSTENRSATAKKESLAEESTKTTNQFLSVLAREPELRATVIQSNKGHAKNSWPILIVSGNVLNSGEASQSGVIVEGKILGREGNVIASATAPCGVLYRHAEIKETPQDQIEDLYTKNGKLLECSIRRGRAKKYQLIFNNIPRHINDDITVKVRASSLRDRS